MSETGRNFLRIVIIGAIAGGIAGMAHFFVEKQVKSIL